MEDVPNFCRQVYKHGVLLPEYTPLTGASEQPLGLSVPKQLDSLSALADECALAEEDVAAAGLFAVNV